MAAPLGFKDFTTGEVLTAGDVDGYLMQGIWVFASAAARDAAVTSPQEGNFAFLKDTNVTTYYTGSAWANLDTTGMTNPMTTTGDTIYSSSGSTPARLGIGSTGQVLTVSGGIPSWATPSGGTAIGCILYNTSNYTISNATDTILTFNTEILDTDGFHSTVTNTGRITIPAGKAGKYYVFAWGSYANNTTGYRQLEILVNGRTGTPSRVGNDSASSANNMGLNPVGAAVLTDGDYIEVNTYQNSGGSLTFYGGAADVQFGALYLGA
jgi:hypothetical protein